MGLWMRGVFAVERRFLVLEFWMWMCMMGMKDRIIALNHERKNVCFLKDNFFSRCACPLIETLQYS
jgi:hypothetical protein